MTRLIILAWALVHLPVASGMRIRRVIGQPWSTSPAQMPSSFHESQVSGGKNQSQFAPFLNERGQASITKATAYLKNVKAREVPDPFPSLKSFYVYSANQQAWFRFARQEKAVGETEVDRQLIITVQSGQNSFFCLRSIECRVKCAVVFDRYASRKIETAGTWTIVGKPIKEASEWSKLQDLSDHFGGSLGGAREQLLKTNGKELGLKAFVLRSLKRKDEIFIFEKQHVSEMDLIRFVVALGEQRGPLTYPDHVCPGGSGDVDIKRGLVLPFPGASSWMLQLKWLQQEKPKDKSPILDMEDNWRHEISRINENPGRVRIYFVGHSSKRKDWFGSRTGRQYDSTKVANMLVGAGLTSKRSVTISFVACHGAMHFCPALARKLRSIGYRKVKLHCREPEVARWPGGEFVKKTLQPEGPVHKAKRSKKVFRTSEADPGQGVYSHLEVEQTPNLLW